MLAWLAALALTLTAAADPWDDVARTAEMPVEQVQELVRAHASKQDSVLERMARPWEARPWHRYHPIFLNDERVSKGLDFWEANAETLARVSDETGVPAEIIVSILGVETRYGEVMGNDRVIDALYTLGFYHERRGAFFRRELGHFLRLATDEGWPLQEPMGSYAGAMGYGQFIPSSYRAYAVDGSGDGKRDLFGSADDAIASIANYFIEHGWRRGEPVLLPATGDGLQALVSSGLELDTTVGALAAAGARIEGSPAEGTRARLFDFELAEGREYRVGLQNFYAITRYNRSKHYARAVYELAGMLREGRERRAAAAEAQPG